MAQNEQGEIRLVGSCHTDDQSEDAVKRAIALYEPDVVAVELDAERYPAIVEENEDTSDHGWGWWLLSRAQKRFAASSESEVGSEFRAACEMADKCGAKTALIDRPVSTVVEELSTRMGLVEKFISLFFLALMNIMPRFMVSDTPKFSTKGIRRKIFVISFLLPTVIDVVFEGRNRHMATRLEQMRNEGKTVVAVVGAGHRSGIDQLLQATN